MNQAAFRVSALDMLEQSLPSPFLDIRDAPYLRLLAQLAELIAGDEPLSRALATVCEELSLAGAAVVVSSLRTRDAVHLLLDGGVGEAFAVDGAGCISKTLGEQQATFLPDLSDHADLGIQLRLAPMGGSLLCLPLVDSGECVGVLCCHRHTPDAPTTQENRVLGVVSALLAGQVRKRRMFDGGPDRSSLRARLKATEREIIVAALKRSNGKVAPAARELGTTERILRYRVKLLGLHAKAFKRARRERRGRQRA